MITSSEDTVWIVTRTEAITEPQRGGELRNPFNPRSPFNETVKSVPVASEDLQAEMTKFLGVMGKVFQHAETQAPPSGLQLDEVELTVEIGAEGKIQIWGIGGVESNAGGAIKLTFRRPQAD